MTTTTLESFIPPSGDNSPALKIIRNCFTDSTSNEYIGIYGLGKEFSKHYAKLNQIRFDRALWVENAEPPTESAVSWAWLVIEELFKVEFVPNKIVASAEGGVAICFVSGDKYADIECLNSEEILGVISNRRDRPSVWKIEQNTRDIARATEQIYKFIKKTKTGENASKTAWNRQ